MTSRGLKNILNDLDKLRCKLDAHINGCYELETRLNKEREDLAARQRALTEEREHALQVFAQINKIFD